MLEKILAAEIQYALYNKFSRRWKCLSYKEALKWKVESRQSLSVQKVSFLVLAFCFYNMAHN